MAVRIRMKKTGAKNKPCYRIVVADARSQRDGKIIENLGFYDPRHNDEKINLERAEYWMSVGAEASETVTGVIKRAKGGEKKAAAATAKPEAIKEPKSDVEKEIKEEAK